MLKVIMLKGLPGSGKSSWAKVFVDKARNSVKRINKDDLRAMLDNSHHSTDAEKFIIKARDTLILLALENGRHVIVDDTNLAPKHETHIRQLIKGRAEFEVKDFTHVDVDTCIKRDLQRCNSVGEKVIRDMYNKYLAPPVPKLEHNPKLPCAVICDLDGTLCLLNGRNPYDASTCQNDILNEVVDDLLRSERLQTTKIFLTSGREDKYKEQTIKWLWEHDVPFTDLFMRKSGDYRKDSIVKQEMYEEHIKDKYNVRYVLDDRSQVVKMWRSLGLTCLQVADGDF